MVKKEECEFSDYASLSSFPRVSETNRQAVAKIDELLFAARNFGRESAHSKAISAQCKDDWNLLESDDRIASISYALVRELDPCFAAEHAHKLTVSLHTEVKHRLATHEEVPKLLRSKIGIVPSVTDSDDE